ncbi:hypothetical protein [Nocardioides sp.]|uniref:hypothetical protein n=1 Tax=Nocardioides sp. TaxID=35761 RepID=UPI0035627B21
MTYVFMFAVIAALLAFEAVRMMVRDGRGPQRPPSSHFEDPRFHSPGGVSGRLG